MADIDCSTCQDLKEYAPGFVQNGISDAMCTSLKNGTGLIASAKHNDCDDLSDINDCTVGLMDDELEKYEACDWKKFMHKFIPNLYNLFKGIICAACGLWENVHSLWDNITEIWCWLEHMTTSPQSYSLKAYDENMNPINGFRIAQGVHMRTESPLDIPISVSVRGSVAFINGSLRFDAYDPEHTSPSDPNYGGEPMPSNYTNGVATSWRYLQHGCASLTNIYGSTWGANGVCTNLPLIWEIQFKKCQLGFSSFFGRNFLYPGSNGDFLMRPMLYKKGDLVPPDWEGGAYQQDGETPWPDSYVFNPDDDDMMLLQIRLQNTRLPLTAPTPGGNCDVIPCTNVWSCN